MLAFLSSPRSWLSFAQVDFVSLCPEVEFVHFICPSFEFVHSGWLFLLHHIHFKLLLFVSTLICAETELSQAPQHTSIGRKVSHLWPYSLLSAISSRTPTCTCTNLYPIQLSPELAPSYQRGSFSHQLEGGRCVSLIEGDDVVFRELTSC